MNYQIRLLSRLKTSSSAMRVLGRARIAAIAVCSSVMLFSGSQVTAQQNLPIMGEPADAALSPAREQQLGAQFMRQIRSRLPLVRDVQAAEYIQRLGDRLVASSGKAGTGEFTFFIINDPSINAFAIPGGYVGVNTGLIAAMAEEEQLASVLAHEIAHVTQRHHARAFATSNKTTLSTAAAVLAAIIIGQASPQAGQAALAAGLAASQQSTINFTRNNEVEADRIGIEILANADFDTSAMAETFDILRRQNSLNTSGLVLEYLRTHPLDNNRIAEAADRANSIPSRARQNSLDFKLFKARLDVLTSNDVAQTARQYKALHRRDGSENSSYALAMIASRDNKKSDARNYLDALSNGTKNNPFVALMITDTYAQNQSQQTESGLRAMAELYPERYSIVEKQLQFLDDNRRLREAMQLAKRYLRSATKPDPSAWMQLARFQQKLGDSAGSHESLARYFEALDEPGRASSQLRLALREVPKGSQDEIRLSARVKQLQEEAARLR